MHLTARMKVTFRCVQANKKTTTLRRYTTSSGFTRRRAGALARTSLLKAIENFSFVWRRKKIGSSRYSDGSYAVLYTATKPEVAKIERFYWLAEAVFKKTRQREVDDFLVYSCRVGGKYLNYTRNWKKNKLLVHPTNYDYCQRLAKRSRDAGVDFLIVPSARKLGGCCVPVFNESEVEIKSATPLFKVFWDERTQRCYTLSGKKPQYVTIDPVYRMV